MTRRSLSSSSIINTRPAGILSVCLLLRIGTLAAGRILEGHAVAGHTLDRLAATWRLDRLAAARLGRFARQEQFKGCAFAGLTLDNDSPAVLIHDFGYQRQAQPHSAGLGGEEGVENIFHLVVSNA